MTDEQKIKTNQGQKCNRRCCQNADAQWYNHSTQAYYCESCAILLNRMNKEDAMRLYGHNLCTLSEVTNIS